MKKLLLLTFFVTCICTFCQNNSESLFYTSFDNTIGQNNTPLSYGVIYKEKYIKKIKDNHNFFLNDKFNEGSIHYRDQPFFNVQLKYDIVNDLIILKINSQDQIPSIILDKDLVRNFRINNFRFQNTPLGFLEEVVMLNNYSIYKKHKKISKENIDGTYKHYTFKSKNPQFILFYNGKYYTIKSKRDFIKIFPDQKKKIIKYYRSNRHLFKNSFKNFVIKLMNQLQV